jgi:organic hydroperoxide reductase OsmC/OhrA
MRNGPYFRKEFIMTQHEKVLYTAKVHTGGRDGGASRSDDGRLDIKHSIPGTPGTGTNPEQLLAAVGRPASKGRWCLRPAP